MQKTGVFIAVLAATVALASATGCFYCASGGCTERKEVCFWASPAPVYWCEEPTTPCGDRTCGWNEKCISTKSCGYGYCKRILKCLKVAEPKKCEYIQVCRQYYGNLVCKVEKECKGYEPVRCGDKWCQKGFACNKTESKKVYVCDSVCGSKSACSCDSGKVCRFSDECGVKSVHPTYNVYYYPGTSGTYGNGGYYQHPTGSSSAKRSPTQGSPSGRSPSGRSPSGRSPSGRSPTGRSPTGGSPSRGPPAGGSPTGGSPTGGGVPPPNPPGAPSGQVNIKTKALAAYNSAASAGGDFTVGPGSIFAGNAIAQAAYDSQAQSYVGGTLGDYSAGVGLAYSGALYGGQAASQALVYGDNYGAGLSRAESFAVDDGIALADAVSGGYDGGSGIGDANAVAYNGGIASALGIGLGSYGGIGEGYADARAYDYADVKATADGTSFTPGLHTTANAVGFGSGRGSVVRSNSKAVDETGITSVTAAAGPNGQAFGSANFTSTKFG